PDDDVFKLHYNGVFIFDPLRSPPVKSRPLRNDFKGKVMFTSMYNHDDEGFGYYPHLNDDEVGHDNIVTRSYDLENEGQSLAINDIIVNKVVVDKVADNRVVDNVVDMVGQNINVDDVEDMNVAVKGVSIDEDVFC
ncbi:hypothetical protein Tco_1209749, partial [Tanacetum coccineum]